jgi:hypothetical protein
MTANGGSAKASYHGPSWASYLDTHPGRSCTLKGHISMGQAGSVTSTLTQTVISSSASTSGTVVHYRLQTSAVASQGSVPPTGTSQTVPYEILRNGTLGVAPGTYSLSEGLQVTLDGFEVYPSVADLQSGRRITSTVMGSLTGTTAAARKEAAQLTSNGQPLRLRFVFSVSGAPAPASVRTPAGTFRHLVEVKIALDSMTALNATPQTKSALAGGSGLAQAFGSRLYFAEGTGLVVGVSAGIKQRLTGCT